jgi:urease accessory protein
VLGGREAVLAPVDRFDQVPAIAAQPTAAGSEREASMTGDRLLPDDVRALIGDSVGATAPHVDLVFSADSSRCTTLRRQHVTYPFHVGRTWAVPGDPDGMTTLYVQSCSGGLFQHDDLAWNIVAREGAKAHVTTAAATVVHRMDNGHARQAVTLEADRGTLLEYFPDSLILFRGARLFSELTLRVHPQAVVMARDAIVPHDPTGGDGVFDWIASDLRVETPDGSLLARDRYRLEGSVLAGRVPGVTGPFKCQGAFIVVQQQIPQRTLLDALRAAIPADQGLYAGASSLPAECGVWLRVLAADSVLLRDALERAWYSARRLITGTQPRPRRK